jgi:hypothetical protein
MGARGDSAAVVEPLLAAAAESGIFAAGGGAMEEVLVDTEDRLEAILWRADGAGTR